MPAKKTFNPFYVLLIPAGLVFAVTAFAYGYMAFQAVNAIRAEAGAHAGHPLFQWLRAHGDAALLIELALLAVLTVAAIATDKLWERAAQERKEIKFGPPRRDDAKELNTK
jgi:hypothetical protein